MAGSKRGRRHEGWVSMPSEEAVSEARQRVVVIGAGPAGAAAAEALSRDGYEVTVFERSDQLGGRTRTYRADGRHVDTGAAFITNFYKRTWQIAKRIGFDNEIVELNRLSGLAAARRLAVLDIGSALSFLKFPFVTLFDKLRMLWFTLTLTLRRQKLDIAKPETLLEYDAESVSQWVNRKTNQRVLDYLVRPGIEPFWYFSCDQVSAGLCAGLTAHAAGARFFYLKDGIDRVCGHLLKEVEVRTGMAVREVAPGPDGSGVVVSVENDEERYAFDAAVIATTADVAARLVQQHAGELGIDQGLMAFLGSQEYVANIHLTLDVQLAEKPPGVSSIFPCGEGQHPMAALSFHGIKDNEGSNGDSELISIYLSDPESRRLMDVPDEQVVEQATQHARALWPAMPTDGRLFSLTRRRQAIPLHGVGRYRKSVEMHTRQQAGGAVVMFAGDYLTTATVDGAIESGLRAANALKTGLLRRSPGTDTRGVAPSAVKVPGEAH